MQIVELEAPFLRFLTFYMNPCTKNKIANRRVGSAPLRFLCYDMNPHTKRSKTNRTDPSSSLVPPSIHVYSFEGYNITCICASMDGPRWKKKKPLQIVRLEFGRSMKLIVCDFSSRRTCMRALPRKIWD